MEKEKGEKGRCCELKLRVSETFDLEKAVCSHGLFMMPPNYWHSPSKTFLRPLRLSLFHDYANDDADDHHHDHHASTSHLVSISHSQDDAQSLCIRVFGTRCLSSSQQEVLLDQVKRMLRLSADETMKVKGFQDICGEARERNFGRVFRSPTLFEDMVKCILLCNCQWPRTLAMARSLCELQLELQHQSCSVAVSDNHNEDVKFSKTESQLFIPKTPQIKESKRKSGGQITTSDTTKADRALQMCCDPCQNLNKIYEPDSCSLSYLQFPEDIGNFPSPRELASLNEGFLAKRCNLGYRASRILKLARSIVEGKIQLRKLEEACDGTECSTNYEMFSQKLMGIDGFGPFTCANVLMCMGFYHVIPTDTETIRHLNQVYSRKSTIKTIQKDVEEIYGKYAPFQFLAYWSELWHFYERRFGKPSEMLCSDYKLITASNMRMKRGGTGKRTKLS